MRVLLAISLITGTAAFAACGPGGADGEAGTAGSLCVPGDNVFCKCRGGGEGTKTCKDDGNSYEECVNLDGTCEEIPDPATSSGDPGSTSGDPGGTSGGQGGGGTGSKALLEACAADGECASGMCPMGFCTQDCASWQECVVGDGNGECVRLQGNTVQWCVPYCVDQSDCSAFGQDSYCGFAPTLDGMGIAVTSGSSGFPVCAHWGAELALPPDTTECPQPGWTSDDDLICHLGLAGAERVCAFGQCTDGCHVDDDCPSSAPSCSATGSLGSCN